MLVGSKGRLTYLSNILNIVSVQNFISNLIFQTTELHSLVNIMKVCESGARKVRCIATYRRSVGDTIELIGIIWIDPDSCSYHPLQSDK